MNQTDTTSKSAAAMQRAHQRRQRIQTIILIIVGVVVIAVGITLVSLLGGPRTPYEGLQQSLSIDGALVLGDFENAPAAVFAFLDYTDISSARLQSTLRRLIDPYVRTGQVVLAEYLLTPITDYYADAIAAVEATHCAAEQGAAWPMHDALFSMWERQFEFYGQINAPPPLYSDNTEIEIAARQVQIDPDALMACIREGQTRDQIDAAAQTAEQVGVGQLGLPAIFVDDQLMREEDGAILNEPSYEQLSQAIERALDGAP